MSKEAVKQKKTHEIIYAILKLKYKPTILGGLALLTIFFGTYGFLENGEHPITSILNSVKMFGLDYPSLWSEINWQIILAVFFAICTLTFVAVVLLIKNSYDKYKVYNIFGKKHNVVFGLGSVSLSFLNTYSQKQDRPGVVIIESDSNNKNIEEFRKKGMGVLTADAFNDETLDILNLSTMKNAIIALGSDRVNIELSKKIINLYEKNQIKEPIKLIVHIQNRDLDILFHQQFMIPDQEKVLKIDIKTFSFFQEVAKDLFEDYRVDGETQRFIETDEEFCSILIGDGVLVKSIIYQMAQISHLPNENVHTVFIVDKDADNLIVKIKKHLYYNENNFPTFKLEAINIDSNNLEFFNNNIWHRKNIANIIIANDTEADNLDIAVELFNRTFLTDSVDNNTEMPNILFAIYDQQLLAEKINDDFGTLKNFNAFGNSDSVLTYDNLIEEKKDLIAKLIHMSYGNLYKPDKLGYDEKVTNEKWYNRNKYSNKLSSIAQANHINMKLKSMGLKKEPQDLSVSLNKNELLKANQNTLLKVFDKDRKNLGIDEEELVEYSKELDKYWADDSYEVKYFPEAYTTLFEKMIRMEHNRWNAYHYLNGWEYEEIVCNTKFDNTKEEKKYFNDKKEVNSRKKKHDCLLPLKDFKDGRLQITVFYDIYSFLYLPNYLAEAGYKIVGINDNAKSS